MQRAEYLLLSIWEQKRSLWNLLYKELRLMTVTLSKIQQIHNHQMLLQAYTSHQSILPCATVNNETLRDNLADRHHSYTSQIRKFPPSKNQFNLQQGGHPLILPKKTMGW